MSEEQERFEVGDIVRLKSGGPEMTVGQVDQFAGTELAVECEWLDSSHKPQSRVYPVKTLVRVERNPTKK